MISERMRERQRIEQQTEAEFAFAQTLETQGVDTVRFLTDWGLSLHQFNVLAHYVYGVNDEELLLPPTLKALLLAVKEPRPTLRSTVRRDKATVAA